MLASISVVTVLWMTVSWLLRGSLQKGVVCVCEWEEVLVCCGCVYMCFLVVYIYTMLLLIVYYIL